MIPDHMTWVISSDSNTCRIYNYRKNHRQLTLIKEIQHPENKLRDSDLTSDKPGRWYQSSGLAHGSYSQPTDPKEIKIDNFAKEIAEELNLGRKNNAYQNLIVITSPHMKGLLFQHLDDRVKNLIIHDFQKNLIHLSHHELLEFLKLHTQFPNES